MKTKTIYFLLQNIIAFCVALLLSLAIEIVGFNYNLIFSGALHNGDMNVLLSDVIKEGYSEENGSLVSIADNARVIFQVPGGYINKLEYGYLSDNDFTETVTYTTVNGYQKEFQNMIVNNSSARLNFSVMNLNCYTNEIELSVPSGVQITYIKISNHIVFSFVRFFCVFLTLIAGYFLVAFRRYLAKKIEVGFLVLSIGIGSVMILSSFTMLTSWDEQYHFEQVYRYSSFGAKVEWTEAAFKFVNLDVPGISMASSLEETENIASYIDSMDSRENIALREAKSIFIDYSNTGYYFQSLVYRLARILGFSFGTSFLFGKFANLIFYSVVMFFAIRIVPIGKRVLTAIGLMPTPLFLASNYSYDPTVTACLVLGFSVIVSELLQPEKMFSMKNAIIYTICMLLGSFPKAVYIPLILLALLLPKQKFVSLKQMRIFKSGIVLLFLLVMSTFVLPMLTGTRGGDPRGGDTSVSRQLVSILTHPFTFIVNFTENIFGSFGEKFIGCNSLNDLAYYGSASENYNCVFASVAIILFSMFTDTESTVNRNGLLKKQKIILLILISIIVCMIWGALYLSFTPVGESQIFGVQGRYFIPLMFPLALLIRTSKIKCLLSAEFCNTFALAVPAAVSIYMCYSLMITRFSC